MFLSFLNVQTQFDKISIIIKIASFIFKDTAEDVNRIRKHSFGTIYVNKDCNNSAIYFHIFICMSLTDIKLMMLICESFQIHI